ncbi:S1 family peptidase [Ferruginibacter profundus]
MEDIVLLDAVERYLRGEMSAEERTFLEEMRKSNPEVDQMVVEHTFFLNEVDKYSSTKNFKHSLVETEAKLTEEGVINPSKLPGKAKVVFLWKRYKRIAAVAASIAGIVSILTAGITSVYNSNKTNPEIEKLKRDLGAIKEGQKQTNSELNAVKSKIGPNAIAISGGTGFLIDAQGYLITNAHVLQGKTIIATNEKGRQFVATVCMQDNTRDIAVLKIDDKDFIPYKSLPYSISKSVNLAEPVYTMGYPKDGIVYGEGYLSSETGYQNDTLSYQIAIAADHGNSGGPVLNKNGDVIGILSDKSAGGGVYAVKSMYIFKTVENLKKDSAFSNIKLNATNSIKNLIRENQVKKINSCVFLIKSYQ